ncbi:NAD(P)-binding domain-containing protein [Elizabethkingia meningoseptica]|uniref:NAD(P)-binding domain-containing protein n=1 Tax=Elizabethkingia meningoseptica TaxID=238 RepID=UPI00389286A7
MKRLAIIGYGWLGRHIAHYFSGKYHIYKVNRKEENENTDTHFCIDFDTQEPVETNTAINHADIIIICLPFSQRTDRTQLTIRFNRLSRYIGKYNGQIFLTSSTGIYPLDKKLIDETTYHDTDLIPNLIQVENQMKESYPQINILRLGGLMGADRKLSNYSVKDTDQVVNHVHYADVCRAIETLINRKVAAELYNIVAPKHPSKQEVISFQKNEPYTATPRSEDQRVISSEKIQTEQNFIFKKPDPKLF